MKGLSLFPAPRLAASDNRLITSARREVMNFVQQNMRPIVNQLTMNFITNNLDSAMLTNRPQG
ncbi:MAG TPA: hypothetical protein DCL54_05865 [Alphaproteobacteria bacterium]|nr:hypothetical protein [Alphaproteobacteria bacterium]HAJ46089.1 hypothetical protein [Alphaproteobacteria bacterium]